MSNPFANDGTNLDDRAARAATISDWFTLARYIAPRCRREIVAAAISMDANCLPAWHRLSRYALFELKETERVRPLTPYEEQIRRIAERLYDVTINEAKGEVQ